MDITLDRPELFPTETLVGAYLPETVTELDAAPRGAPIASAKVGLSSAPEAEKETFDEKTAVVLKGLTGPRVYLAGGKVPGTSTWRYVRFIAGNLSANLSAPARYPAHGV